MAKEKSGAELAAVMIVIGMVTVFLIPPIGLFILLAGVTAGLINKALT